MLLFKQHACTLKACQVEADSNKDPPLLHNHKKSRACLVEAKMRIRRMKGQNENYNVYLDLDMSHGLFLKISSIPAWNDITRAPKNAKQSKQTANNLVFPQKLLLLLRNPKGNSLKTKARK
ncbi:hypothetical protein E2542_SST08513 [Spatholobus suberectus]|nr:hypothetical protein E2542_SST08513 [Spatholobus suberectus]